MSTHEAVACGADDDANGSEAGGANRDGMEATPEELSRDYEGLGTTLSGAIKEPPELTEDSEMKRPC